MTYQLYRAADRDEASELATELGEYANFRDALLARDQDVLRMLEHAAGRRIELTHLIVGPGHDGPRTPHAVVCSVGQPDGWPVDLEAEIAATAHWLEQIHRQLQR